jgi:hypothetical protein
MNKKRMVRKRARDRPFGQAGGMAARCYDEETSASTTRHSDKKRGDASCQSTRWSPGEPQVLP